MTQVQSKAPFRTGQAAILFFYAAASRRPRPELSSLAQEALVPVSTATDSGSTDTTDEKKDQTDDGENRTDDPEDAEAGQPADQQENESEN